MVPREAVKQKDGAFATLAWYWVTIEVRNEVDQGEIVAIRSHQAGVLEDFELTTVAPDFQVLVKLGSHLTDVGGAGAGEGRVVGGC